MVLEIRFFPTSNSAGSQPDHSQSAFASDQFAKPNVEVLQVLRGHPAKKICKGCRTKFGNNHKHPLDPFKFYNNSQPKYKIPLAIRGGCWTPRFCRGPQGQVQKKSLLNQPLLSRLGCYFLQNQEPCTKEKSDKANSYVLQNQDPHMRKYQVNICWIFFSKNLQDDSVEILVGVDSVEIFCWSLIL